MQETTQQTGGATPAAPALPLRRRAALWTQQAWRPAGTVVAVLLILVFGWGVVNGRHGLSAWQKQRTQDQQLRKEIQEMQDENGRLRNHVDRLKSDPDTIEQEARKQLHYAKQGEVIYTLPPEPKNQQQTPASAK